MADEIEQLLKRLRAENELLREAMGEAHKGWLEVRAENLRLKAALKPIYEGDLESQYACSLLAGEALFPEGE